VFFVRGVGFCLFRKNCVLDAEKLGNHAVEVLGFWRSSVGKCGSLPFACLALLNARKLSSQTGF
jgi:hypothetical protein